MGIWTVFSLGFLLIKLYKHSFMNGYNIFSFLLAKYLQMDLLSCIVNECLSIRTCQTVSHFTVPIALCSHQTWLILALLVGMYDTVF